MNSHLANLASRRRVRVAMMLGAAVMLGALLNAIDVQPAASQSAPLRSRPVLEDPGLDPSAGAWTTAPSINIALSAQNITYPLVKRSGGPASVTVRALNTRTTLYVRVDWADATRDDRLQNLNEFSDAVAVEFPTQANVSTPAICMGAAGAGVNIWQWRAVLQGPTGLDWRAAHPNMFIDDDPWLRVEPPLAFPARYVGNIVSSASQGPVSDLTAEVFGTLMPTTNQLARGAGRWEGGHWSVVFARDLATTAKDEAALGGGVTTDMAVAVWDGSQGDRNGQKAVSQFIKLTIPATIASRTTRPADGLPFVAGALVAILAAAAVAGWVVRGTGSE